MNANGKPDNIYQMKGFPVDVVINNDMNTKGTGIIFLLSRNK